MRTVLRAFICLLGSASVCGCYHYEPVAVAALRPPSEVRLVLQSDWIPVAGVGERADAGFLLRGRFVEELADTIVVRPDIEEKGLFSYAFDPGLQPVQIPERQIIRIERKQFDRRNTLLVSGSVGALVGLFLWNRLGGETGHLGNGPNGLPSDAALLAAP